MIYLPSSLVWISLLIPSMLVDAYQVKLSYSQIYIGGSIEQLNQSQISEFEEMMQKYAQGKRSLCDLSIEVELKSQHLMKKNSTRMKRNRTRMRPSNLRSLSSHHATSMISSTAPDNNLFKGDRALQECESGQNYYLYVNFDILFTSSTMSEDKLYCQASSYSKWMSSIDGANAIAEELKALGVCANGARRFKAKGEIPEANCPSPIDESLELDLARMYAPVIRLSRFDNNFPSSVEDYFEIVHLKDESGNTITTDVTSEVLKTNCDDKNYLEWKLVPDVGAWTGEMPELNQETGEFYSNAPVYAKVLDEGDEYHIVYAVFWPLNGYQTFRAGFASTSGSSKKRNFEWAHFAEHQSDFENIHIFINKSSLDLVHVAASAHGKSHSRLAKDAEKKDNRPVLYSAWNSHAMYFNAAVHTLEDIPDVAGIPILEGGFVSLSWLKAVDITEIRGEVDAAHWKYTPSLANVPYYTLDPLFNEGQLTIVNEQNLQNDPKLGWLYFNGKWGPPNRKQNIAKPPDETPEAIYYVGKGADFIGKIPEDKIITNGALGPRRRDWWSHLKTMLIPSRAYGDSSNGSPFNDYGKLEVLIEDGRQFSIRQIKVRSGKRIDRIEFTLTTGDNFSHGGSSGGYSSLVLDSNEYLTSVDYTFCKKDGTNRVCSIRFTTSKGRTLARGSVGSYPVRVEAPKGYQIVGMHGNSGAEIDYLGFHILRLPVPVSNIALQGVATQASTGPSGSQDAIASRAIDGNTDGNFNNKSVTHTACPADENGCWWKVDLNGVATIKKVVIWNRTDCCSDRLSDAEVHVLDSIGNIVARKNVGDTKDVQQIELEFDNTIGSAVRVQLVDHPGIVSLAEVEVFGTEYLP